MSERYTVLYKTQIYLDLKVCVGIAKYHLICLLAFHFSFKAVKSRFVHESALSFLQGTELLFFLLQLMAWDKINFLK